MGGEEVLRKLRLMDQPLHRFDSPDQDVLDGGLFAFVEGTDPEAWLILEAVESPGSRSWRFALARMNIDALRVRRGESIVQEWGALREAWSDRTRPYVMFNFKPDEVLAEIARSKEQTPLQPKERNDVALAHSCVPALQLSARRAYPRPGSSGFAVNFPPREPRTFRELLDRAVYQLEVFADAEAKSPAKPIVALRWANNARGSEDGLTLIYVFEGRPLAAACLYPWEKRLIHDLEGLGRFDSLGHGKIVGRNAGDVVWQPQTSGVTFAPIPDAPTPEATPTAGSAK